MTRVHSMGTGCRSRWPLVAIAALMLLAPAAASASCSWFLGESPPTVQPATVTPHGTNPDGSIYVSAGAAVTAECSATAPSGKSIGTLEVSFDGGFAYTSIAITPANAVTGTVAWTVPIPASYPGSASLICQAILESSTCGATSTPLAVNIQPPPAGSPPVVDSLTPSATSVFVGGSIQLTAAAHDPDGDAITYAWSATDGTIVGTGSTATWTATTSGGAVVTVTVTDSTNQSASMSVSVAGVWTSAEQPMASSGGGSGFSPSRIAFDLQGNAYVTNTYGTIEVFTAKGEPFRSLRVGGTPSGIAVAPNGEIYLADFAAGRVSVLDPAGRMLRLLGRGNGEFQGPRAIAVHPSSGRVYVAEGPAARVRIFDEVGNPLGTLDCAGGGPVGVALDPAGLLVYVSDSAYGTVRVFNTAGAQLRTIGTFDLQLVRPSGLTLGPDGNLYVVDAYAGHVAVFAPASGALLAYVGAYGTGPGQLKIPLDVAADFRGRLAVTDSQNARVDVFALPSFAGVACAGDSDCDGMPDAWELAHGLDPNNAADAWLDPDGDGLLNIEEYWHGTDPHNRDTDGDGVWDGAEVLAGGDPLDPRNNLPVADAGANETTVPTRVTLDGRGSHDPNGDALIYAWRQASGAETVTLHGADTATPWFVAREAGDYRFVLRVYDGKAWSAESDVAITVLDVPPTADAGPDFGAPSGEAVTLDARFSSDANGDGLTYSWTQAAGPSVTLSGATTARPSFTPTQSGVYAFDLVVSDGANASAPARVRVVVDAPGDHVPVAMVPSALDAAPVFGAVGVSVALDGSASADADGSPLTYAWTQVEGPPAALVGVDQMVASFLPAAPGVYRFELVVNDGQHDSLPEPVTVVVSAAFMPPLAAAGYDRRVKVLDEVALGCGFSFGAAPMSCNFRQVQGVQVPLRVAGRKATFVPIDPGTYVFELQVSDSSGLGTRDRVTIVADADGRSVPVASAVAGAAGAPGTAVTLDGSSSFDPDGGATLGYVWSQVRGPRAWVDDPRAAAVQVTPAVAGYYVFELRADDGALRSAPARVAFAVGDGVNPPPVARAGDDVLVQPGTVASLDGTGSTGATAWRWTQVGGPLGAQLGDAAASALTVKPPLSGMTLRLRLGVTAGALTGVPDDVYVNVADVPLALQRVEVSGGSVVVAKAGNPLDGLRADVPAGAFAGPVQLALGEVTRAWYAADGREPIHGAILVGPVGEPLWNVISLTVPIGTDPAKKGATASDVQVVVYDEAADDWKPVAGVTADVAAGKVTFPVARLGVYQVTLTAGLKGTQVTQTTSSGCGTLGASGSGPGAGFALLLLAALLARPLRLRRRAGRGGGPESIEEERTSMTGRSEAKAWRFLLVVALALAASRALGTDSPHDTTNLVNACQDCHLVHNSLGPGLINDSLGNDHLCLSCHGSNAKVVDAVVQNWRTGAAPAGDEASPLTGTYGTSHNWEASAFEPKFGTTTPTDPAIFLGTGGTLMCSTCHDQHKQTNAPFDIRSPTSGAGRHYLKVANDAAQLCTSCHSQWNYTNISSASYLCSVSDSSGCTSAAGTAKFSSTTVTGTSTNWKSGGILKAGWRIKCKTDAVTAFAVIRSVASDTSITLASSYAGTGCAASAGAWEAAPTLSHPSSLPVTGIGYHAPPYDSPVYGKVTGGSLTTITVDGSTYLWATNALYASNIVPRYIRFTSGANKDLVSTITGNATSGGTTTINLGTALASAPVAGDTFEIGRVTRTSFGKATSAGTTTTIVDSSKASWPNLSGLAVTIVAGSAANLNKTSTIQNISGGTITVSPAFSATATAVGDVYRINWTSNDSGTSTGAGSTGGTITDTSRNWVANSLVNLTVRITTQPADKVAYFGATSTIQSNTNNQITLTSPISGLKTTGGDTYEIGPAQIDVIRGVTSSTPTTTTLSGSFTANTLAGLSVRFLGNPPTPTYTKSYQGVVGSNNQGMVSTITSNTNSQITFTAVPAFTPGSTPAYEIDHDGNMTNNLPLDGAAGTSFTGGNVVCLSCHGAHFADSNSATYDAAPPTVAGAGDGKLLRRDNDERFCSSCHAVKVHSSITTTNQYGAWGDAFTCYTCHRGPHETTNLYLVNQQIATPNSGTKYVDYRFSSPATSMYGYAWGAGTVSSPCGTATTPCGPCEVCHTQTKNPTTSTARFRNTGNPDGHQTGACKGCHLHENGFAAPPSGSSGESGGGNACGPCHGTILDGMDGAAAKVSKHTLVTTSDSPNDDTTSWTGISYLTNVTAANRTCVNMCHADHPHDIGGSTHEWNAYLDARTNATRLSGGTNNSTATRDNTDFDASNANGGMCASCHQTPVDATKPAIPKATYAASAHNTTVTSNGATTYSWSYKLHDGGVFQRNCTKCHSDGADPSVVVTAATATPAGAVHYSAYPQLLVGKFNPNGNTNNDFVCFRCHGNGTKGTNRTGKDIATPLSQTFKHPVESDSVHTTSGESTATYNNGQFSGTNRHVNCVDCHAPHSAQPVASGAMAGKLTAYANGAPDTLTDSSKSGVWVANQWAGYTIRMTSGAASGQSSVIYSSTTAGQLSADFPSTALAVGDSYIIIPRGLPGPLSPISPSTQPTNLTTGSPALTGAWAVIPQFAAPPAPANWNDAAGCNGSTTDPCQEITTQFTTTATYTQTSAAPLPEPYLCVKCHSSFAYGAATSNPPLPYTPSGTANNSMTTAGPQALQSDLVNEFNPNNLSHHAVFARGKNQPIRANFGLSTVTSVHNQWWPVYSTASDTVSVTSGVATFSGTAALPAVVIPGWLIYIGSDTPPQAATPGSSTTGYLEITSINAARNQFSVRAEDGTGGWNTTPTLATPTANWAATAGLGNTFVPPWGPWSVLNCGDCHISATATDPLGPHGSATKWLLRSPEAKTFDVWNGTGLTQVANTPTAGSYVFCQNCHRRDVYGDQATVIAPKTPACTTTTSYCYTRQPHPADNQNASSMSNTSKQSNWTINCMNCHGGARLGAIHGENLGKGYNGVGGSYSGRRLLGGAAWTGVTRSTTTTPGSCWVRNGTDTVDSCGQNHLPATFGAAATYSYEDTVP